jgi:hypothetical protein
MRAASTSHESHRHVSPEDHAPQPMKTRNYTQTVSIAVGCFLMLIGLSGILNPAFMGLHLPPMHSAVLVGGGCLSIWSGIVDDSHKAYLSNLGLGIFFALNAIAGWILGEPGQPQVGHDARDQLLVKIAPGFIELGLVDHILHTVLAIVFVSGAISWKIHHRKTSVHR